MLTFPSLSTLGRGLLVPNGSRFPFAHYLNWGLIGVLRTHVFSKFITLICAWSQILINSESSRSLEEDDQGLSFYLTFLCMGFSLTSYSESSES